MIDCPACGSANIEGADQCEQCQADLSHVGLPESASKGLAQRLLNDSIMELKPVAGQTVLPESTVAEAVQTMIDEHVSGVMVVYQDELVGIFTERDFLMKIAHQYEKLADQPVRKFMSASPEAIEATDSIASGLNRMAVRNYRHIPVMQDNKPVAMVRTKDVLSFLSKHCPEVG